MRVKELVGFLEVNEIAPFHFYTKLSDNEYASCRHLTNEELDDYKKKSWSSEKKYEESKLGVYIADITIDELYEIENKRNPVNLHKILTDISYLFKINVTEYKLIYAVYVILHEVGHWVSFKDSGKTSLEYALWDSKFRHDSKEYGKKVYEMSEDLFEKQRYAEVAVNMYKNIPSEKLADEYAFEHMKEKLDLARKYINDSN